MAGVAGVADTAGRFRHVLDIYWPIGAGVFVVVALALLAWLLVWMWLRVRRWRRSRRDPAYGTG